jgi:hypothetical protein
LPFAILAAMSVLLAHVGHWWGYLLYAVPALIVLGATIQSFFAQRRARRDEIGR